jgi:hypothetical protein
MSLPTTEVRFINVDLEVCGRDDLQWLVDEFGGDAINLHCGRVQGQFLAVFESSSPHGDPNSLIGYFCHLVDNLPTEARAAWDGLFSKVFDIGYDAGVGPKSYESDLRPETITAIAKVGASLRVTIYPPFMPKAKVRTTRLALPANQPFGDGANMEAVPATVQEPGLLIRVNKLYRDGMSAEELYEITRGVWKLGRRRNSALVALSVYRGIVKDVFSIGSWHPAASTPYRSRTPEDVSVPGRWEFLGSTAPEELRAKYVGRSVAHYFSKGQRNPVTYVNCDTKQH